MANSLEKTKGVVDITEGLSIEENKVVDELLHGLEEDVVWQDRAKRAIIETIMTGIYALNREGAIGAIFLGGPTGVGKTQLVKTLAKMLFGNPNAFTRIDCEMLQHPTDVSSLVGATAGYTGYGDAPLFSNIRLHSHYEQAQKWGKLHPIIKDNYRTKNFSIVLVDEAEKANPKIMNAFLGTIQEGRISVNGWDKGGYDDITDMQNTLFIFTSNIGEANIAASKQNVIWFVDQRNEWENNKAEWTEFKNALKQFFVPEFLGRMNHIIRCDGLNTEMVSQIIRLSIKKINTSLLPYYDGKVSISVWERYQSMIEERYAEEIKTKGARPIIRAMNRASGTVGFAMHNPENIFPHGFNGGEIRFDIGKNGEEITQVLENRTRAKSATLLSPSNRNAALNQLIISKISDNQKTVNTYLRCVREYDTSYFDEVEKLEKKLISIGFSEQDIQQMRITTLLDLHEKAYRPSSADEQIIENIGTFHGLETRAIRATINWLVRQNIQLAIIYEYIYKIMGRLPTPPESSFLWSYIHQQVMKRNNRTKKYSQ